MALSDEYWQAVNAGIEMPYVLVQRVLKKSDGKISIEVVRDAIGQLVTLLAKTIAQQQVLRSTPTVDIFEYKKDSPPQISLLERLEAVQVILSSPCDKEEAEAGYQELDDIIAKLRKT